MRNHRMRKSSSKRLFRRTARRVHPKNLYRHISRGGIRL